MAGGEANGAASGAAAGEQHGHQAPQRSRLAWHVAMHGGRLSAPDYAQLRLIVACGDAWRPSAAWGFRGGTMERFGLWGGCEGRQKRRRAKTATFAARTARGGVARGPATKGQSRTLPSESEPPVECMRAGLHACKAECGKAGCMQERVIRRSGRAWQGGAAATSRYRSPGRQAAGLG